MFYYQELIQYDQILYLDYNLKKEKTTSFFFVLDNGRKNRPKYRKHLNKTNLQFLFEEIFSLCCIISSFITSQIIMFNIYLFIDNGSYIVFHILIP